MPEKKKDNTLISQRVKALRKISGMRQSDFAAKLGLDQTTVSKWESGKAKPTPDALVRLAEISEGIDKLFFLEHAGVPHEYFDGEKMIPEIKQAASQVVARAFGKKEYPDPVWIPLYKDAVAAGEPRAVCEEVDEWIPLTGNIAPNTSNLRALKVRGDSMAPIVCDGYIVIIDVTMRDPRRLIGRMVAAREDDGVTIKWLRRDKGVYLLVPQHVSPRIPVRVMRPEDNWGIVGVIVKWIGYPPSGK